LRAVFDATPSFAGDLGLDPTLSLEVHELGGPIRISPDGRYVSQTIAAAGRTPEKLAEPFEPTAQSIRNWVGEAAPDADCGDDGSTTDTRNREVPRCECCV
jgi:hypothetical protein